MIQTIPPFTIEPLAYITPSHAATIKQCGYQLILRRAVKTELLPPSASAEFGTAIHRALELSTRQTFNSRQDAEQFLDNILCQAEERCCARGYEFLTPFANQVKNYGVKRELAIRKIVSTTCSPKVSSSRISIDKFSTTVETEKEIASKRFKMRGKIDAILHKPNGAVLVDYKTGSIVDEDENGERSLKEIYADQLKLYAYLYYEATGEFPIDIYVETLTGNAAHLEITLEQCLDYVQDLDKKVTQINELVQINQFNNLKPTNIDVCRWCSVRPACSFYQPLNENSRSFDLFGSLTAVERLSSGNYSLSIATTQEVSRVIGISTCDADKLIIGYEYHFFNLHSANSKDSTFISTASSSVFEVTP